MLGKPRGGALIPALIAVGILVTVTAATITLGMMSKNDSVRDARSLSQTSCVEAGRQYLLGRLRVFGLDPTTIQLDQTVQLDSGGRRLYTGHVRPMAGGQPTGSVAVVTSVQAVPSQLVGNSNARNRDISNVIVPGSTLGGRAYRVVVACTDPLAGDMELEFTFKYGL